MVNANTFFADFGHMLLILIGVVAGFVLLGLIIYYIDKLNNKVKEKV